MRFFTKEWYELMQQQVGVDGLTKIADKVYSDAEIQAFYERDLKKESATFRALRYLTIGCKDILVEDNVSV